MSTFTICVLPDLQKLTSNSDVDDYNDVIAYIVSQKTARNIQMVVDVGDTMDDGGDSAQVAIANAALAQLDGEIPYIIGIGNKDYNDATGASRTATNFNANYPLATYQTYDWFIDDEYPTGETTNIATKITVGDYTYLFISIEYLPRADALTWAQGIVDSNTDADYIFVNTHAFLDSDGTRFTDSSITNLWNDFITQNDKIEIVWCGHVMGPQRRTDGNVHQHLHNEQDQTGNDYKDSAYIRFYEIDQTDHSVSVTTYNPLTDDQLTDSANQFTFNLTEPEAGGGGGGGGGGDMLITATINAAKVAATDSNKPLLIDLSSLSLTTAELNSARAYSDSGLTTEIAREVVSNGIYVLPSSVTTSLVVYIVIDGTSSDYAVTDTYGAQNVWPSEYLCASHAGGADSTSRGIDFSANGGATVGAASGPTGAATALDGVNDYLNAAYDGVLNFGTSDATLQMIVKSADVSTLQHLFVYGNRDSWTSSDAFSMEITSGDAFNAKVRPSGSGAEVSGGSFSVDTFYKVTVTADRNGNMTLYVNGTSVGTVNIASMAAGSLNATQGLFVGTSNGTSIFAELTVCSIRIKNTIHDANWELTEYNNLMDNASFWTLETSGGGGDPEQNSNFLMFA